MPTSSAQFYLPGDVTPYGPKITQRAPSPGANLNLQQALSLKVESTDYPLKLLLLVALVDGKRELVYGSGVGFGVGYSASLIAAATSFTFTNLRRLGGWRNAVTFTVSAEDEDGGVLEEQYSYTGISEITGPTIGNFVPMKGVPVSPLTTIYFDVLHPAGVAGLRYLAVSVAFPDGSDERVWQGAGFTPYYLALSTRTAIAGGYRFGVLRRGGWQLTPSFSLDAVDVDGRLAEEQSP